MERPPPPPPVGLKRNEYLKWRTANGIRSTRPQLEAAWKEYNSGSTSPTRRSPSSKSKKPSPAPKAKTSKKRSVEKPKKTSQKGRVAKTGGTPGTLAKLPEGCTPRTPLTLEEIRKVVAKLTKVGINKSGKRDRFGTPDWSMKLYTPEGMWLIQVIQGEHTGQASNWYDVHARLVAHDDKTMPAAVDEVWATNAHRVVDINHMPVDPATYKLVLESRSACMKHNSSYARDEIRELFLERAVLYLQRCIWPYEGREKRALTLMLEGWNDKTAIAPYEDDAELTASAQGLAEIQVELCELVAYTSWATLDPQIAVAGGSVIRVKNGKLPVAKLHNLATLMSNMLREMVDNLHTLYTKL